jgi:hypothetical protein
MTSELKSVEPVGSTVIRGSEATDYAIASTGYKPVTRRYI